MSCSYLWIYFPIDCVDGSIRLTGGSSSMEGTIQVCHDNVWGLIADVDWDKQDAQVVCKSLNYSQGTCLKE